jgi:uncharacterized protein (DUF433 family)
MTPASSSSRANGPGNRIRGLRIAVWDVLSWLAAGVAEQESLDDYPELEPEDFRAV